MLRIKQTEKGMTASQNFKVHRDNAKARLARISEMIVMAEDGERKSPDNWGHAGSMGKISGELRELLVFMGGEEE